MSTDAAEALDAITCTRQVRHEISAQLDHDPRRLLAYYKEIQERQAEARPVTQVPPAGSGTKSKDPE